MLGGIMGGGGGGGLLGNIAGGITGGGGMTSPNPIAMAGKAADALGNFLPQKTEYAGDKGHITAGMDGTYDGISDAAMNFPPVGTAVGGIMKAGKLIGKAANALGAGTDGMCVCAGTKVFKANGEIVNIEDLKQEDGIIGWSEDTKQIAPQTIHAIIEPRQKECLEIITKTGFTLRCSIDHPILSDNTPKAKSHSINGQCIAYRDWKFRRADELKIGDFIGVANSIDYWGDVSLDKAYLIGLLIGDGTYTKGNSCRLISADVSTWDYIESNGLGVINHCDDCRPDKYSTEVRTYRIVDGMDLMRQVGLVYQSRKDKTLPRNIGQYTRESICQLLAGLYDTDGSIYVNENKNNWSITLYQSNKNLLQEVKEQLHKLGIFASIGVRKAAQYQLRGGVVNSGQSYRLQVRDIASAIRFTQFIPLNVDYKKDNLCRIYKLLKDKKPQEHPELSGAKQFKIIDIKPIGIQTVYNLQADNDHTYLANGIITHNTTADAILGSSFFNLTPFGLINGIFGKRADTFTKDTEVFGEMGSGYGGSNKQADLAAHKSGKKYGAFSARARRRANTQIAEAKRQQNTISDIQDDVHNQKMLAASMTDTMGRAYQDKLQGGYQQGAIRAAKYGGILFSVEATRRASQIVRAQQGSKLETTEIKKLETYNWPKHIAKDDKFMEFISTLPEEWKEYVEEHEDLYEIWRENGKPKSFSDSTDKLRTPLFILDDSGNTIINPEISEAEDTSKETTEEEPMSEDDFVMEVQKLQDEVESFQKGGQLNVIPEGALHAHKHNLEDIREDLDGEITHKGIPVVSISEDGKVEQQAEIERNEIIFNLEVTKQIEELRKQYEKAETQKEKDAIAIEAGKILSDSIIEDTDDRTNLIKQVD